MDNNKIKEKSGEAAMVGFIISAVYLLWSSTGFASIFRLKSIAFMLGGIFIAPLTLGIALYFFVRLSAFILVSVSSSLQVNSSPSAKILLMVFRLLMQFIAPIVMLYFFYICYQTTKLAFNALL